MSAALLLDALGLANDLQEAGFPPDQAQKVVGALSRRFQEANVATKQDIERLEHKLDLSISNLRGEMHKELGMIRTEMSNELGAIRTEMAAEFGAVRADIASSRSAMMMWFTSVMIAQAGVIVALVKLL